MSICPSSINRKYVSRPLFLASGDADTGSRAEFPVAAVVSWRERLFEPERAEFRESLGSLDGRFRVPDQSRVNHQIGSVAQAFPRFANQRDVRGGVDSHGSPTKLHASEAAIGKSACEFTSFLGSAAKETTRITADARAEAPTQEFPNRQAQRLSFDVPERHVNAAHGVQPYPEPAGIDVLLVHFVPDMLGLKWIFSHYNLFQAASQGV